MSVADGPAPRQQDRLVQRPERFEPREGVARRDQRHDEHDDQMNERGEDRRRCDVSSRFAGREPPHHPQPTLVTRGTAVLSIAPAVAPRGES